MNKKSVTAIIAFAVTFGFSAFLMSFFASPVRDVRVMQLRGSSDTRDKILHLLEQDIRNGERRNTRLAFSRNDFEDNSSELYADAVNSYAEISGSLDDSGLPQDFQIAWRKHMKAWNEKADLLKAEVLYSNDATRVNRLNERSLSEIYDLKGEEINSTWYEVLGIAAKYGAFPENAY